MQEINMIKRSVKSQALNNQILKLEKEKRHFIHLILVCPIINKYPVIPTSIFNMYTFNVLLYTFVRLMILTYLLTNSHTRNQEMLLHLKINSRADDLSTVVCLL